MLRGGREPSLREGVIVSGIVRFCRGDDGNRSLGPRPTRVFWSRMPRATSRAPVSESRPGARARWSMRTSAESSTLTSGRRGNAGGRRPVGLR
jgi:hypothetical protein